MADGAEGPGDRPLKDARGRVSHSRGRNSPEREEGMLLTLTLEGRKKVCNKCRQVCSPGAGVACIFLVKKDVQVGNAQR